MRHKSGLHFREILICRVCPCAGNAEAPNSSVPRQQPLPRDGLFPGTSDLGCGGGAARHNRFENASSIAIGITPVEQSSAILPTARLAG
jgi:hypothetical protein